ncbi:hypothetical protein, partial [Caulobacter sp. BK020]|uniref:hypothetical protein n=1 Tax=Caulobacter sp. BK020 TaxID=2512117 RepID=UPI00104316B3
MVVLVLRQAQDEDDFNGGELEILILSLSKDEDFTASDLVIDLAFEPCDDALCGLDGVELGGVDAQ